MRSADLALYADELAARASSLSARLERARGRMRRAAIEREARRALPPETVARLEAIGVLERVDPRADRSEVAAAAAALRALEELQAWVELELAAAREDGYAFAE